VTVADGRVNVVTGTGIREGRNVTTFRHYDEGLFAALADRAGQPRRSARSSEGGR
jgi:NAD-dependent SIR2 family protein deacetylase